MCTHCMGKAARPGQLPQGQERGAAHVRGDAGADAARQLGADTRELRVVLGRGRSECLEP